MLDTAVAQTVETPAAEPDESRLARFAWPLGGLGLLTIIARIFGK